MSWPSVNHRTATIVTILVCLVASCSTKRKSLDLIDFSQNLRVSAAHQRQALDDTITFFSYEPTDSGMVMVPTKQIQRHATKRHDVAIVDTSTNATIVRAEQVNTRQPNHIEPGWFERAGYDLLLGAIFIIIIAKIARKL